MPLRLFLQLSHLRPYSPPAPHAQGCPRRRTRPLAVHTVRRERLQRGLRRSLIILAPHAFILDRRASHGPAPSPPPVRPGSPFHRSPRPPHSPPDRPSFRATHTRHPHRSAQLTITSPRAPDTHTHTPTIRVSSGQTTRRRQIHNGSNRQHRLKSWCYRGCWHQAGPLLLHTPRYDPFSTPPQPQAATPSRGPTASEPLHRATFAPAGARKHPNLLSRSVSGAAPKSPDSSNSFTGHDPSNNY